MLTSLGRRWRRVLGVVLALGLPPVLLAVDLPADEKADATSRAVAVESAAFLTPPAGLDGSGFTVARTAPAVDVCFFAGLADRGPGTLWSSWGDGCLADSGRYFTSVGDHLGKDGNSYVYEYDPAGKVLRRVVDVLRAIGHVLGLFGHGKIHSGIHQGADGALYFTTYWGKQREVEAAYAAGYPGSLLLRHDPKTGATQNLGAPVPRQGLPASHFDARNQLLYFHAVYKGDVAVYDVKAQKRKYLGGAGRSTGNRTFLAAADGRVYFSADAGGLHYYDPAKNDLVATAAKLPGADAGPQGAAGATLRAAARPAKDGTLYGMTAAGRLFAFDPKTEAVKDLGPNFAGGDYTAVMALSPDEKYLYYAPGAHGSGNKLGAPVVQYDLRSGRRKVLAFLREPLLKQFDYQVGGTYNLQLDARGERLFFTFNGAPAGARGTFGRPAVVVVHIPPGERG